MINSFNSLKRMPILRKNNKIKSIHSSLAIEANSLSLLQVRDLIDGKIVIGPQKEIQKVKNAYLTYSSLNSFNGYLEKDLFEWLKKDNETPILIKSCVFHYEFILIHPFSDENGRIARLWQNVLLSKWNPIFEYIPIESQMQKYQSTYYEKISHCHKNGNSNEFIEFMLEMIDKTLDEIVISVEKESKNISDQVNKLLEIMETGIPYSANDLLKLLEIKTKETLRASYLNPAIENHLIVMSLPDKPNSKNQKYIKL